MNYPTSPNSKKTYSQFCGEPYDESPFYSEDLGPFGTNTSVNMDGLTMVENPINERNRSHEASSPVVTKELVDFINELKRNNEELRQSNQILNQKLDQTLDIIREGFKSIQNALTSSVTNSNVMERRIHKDESDQAKDDSESSSVISGVDYISESSVPEDYVMCHPERTLSGLNNNSPQVPPSDQSDSTSDIVVLSNTMKERFGFEYDPKLDMNFWLRP